MNITNPCTIEDRRGESGGFVPVAWREPFSSGPAWRDKRPEGETVAELVATVPGLPAGFAERGIVCINGAPVPNDCWHLVRPRATLPERPIAVTLHWPLRGGGGSGNSGVKSVLALVGAIALTVVTGGIASGALAGVLGSAFAAGSFGASALAGAVGIIGALAISALTAPPAAKAAASSPTNGIEQKDAASATGNVISRNGAVPRVVGTRRVFPPLAGDPIIEIVDDDQYVEAAFVLNGPHALDDIRIGDANLADAEDIEYEIREGWEDDLPLTLATRQGKQSSLNIQMSTHTVDPSNQANLKHPSAPGDDLPVFHPFASRQAADELWLHLALPAGLCDQTAPTDDKSVPFRIHMRERGDTAWINLPEIHLSERTLSQTRVAIKFIWRAGPGVIPAAPSQSGFVYASINVPGQGVAPTDSGWVAASYFSDGSGSDYLNAGAEATSKVANTLLYDNRVEFYLDPATFPKGVYEFEIKRGAAYDTSSFTASTYAYSGTVYDFFSYFNPSVPQIPLSRANISDAIALEIAQSIWNEPLIAKSGFAAIAIRALNKRVDSLSVLASGYVRDWDGSGWNDWTTTSNPAPHYVDVLSGALNRDPLPDDLRDDTGLVAWRTKCAAKGWTVDTIVEDARTDDLLTLIASCGYARPYQSEIYGVTVDDDRSADDIVQVFSPMNVASFRSEKSFARLPDGFLVSYADASTDYADAQLEVYARGYTGGDGGNFESVNYDGMVATDKVTARAQFDMDQAALRSVFYYLDADMESIVCRKGDLVAVQHDTIDGRAGFARLKEKILDAGDIVGLVLDNQIPITNEPDMHAVTDMHAVADMHDVGVTTGVMIRHDDGTVSAHEISDASGSLATVMLATPVADDASIVGFADSDWTYGALIVSGRRSVEYRRLLVAGIAPDKDGAATLTLVDEAPDLVRYAA